MRNETSVLFYVLFTVILGALLSSVTACGSGGGTEAEAEAEAELEGQEAEAEVEDDSDCEPCDLTNCWDVEATGETTCGGAGGPGVLTIRHECMGTEVSLTANPRSYSVSSSESMINGSTVTFVWEQRYNGYVVTQTLQGEVNTSCGEMQGIWQFDRTYEGSENCSGAGSWVATPLAPTAGSCSVRQ